MGKAAVPDILEALRACEGPGADPRSADWTGTVLLMVLDAMREPSLREALEGMLASPVPAIRKGALDALARLGSKESAPALRRLLEAPDSWVRRRDSDLLCGWGAFAACGEPLAIGEILALAKRGGEGNASKAADVLSENPALRAALGFQGESSAIGYESFDRELFLKAAEEWYAVQVLGAPSPHRAPENPAFSEPYGEAKRSAWKALAESCADPRGSLGAVRCRPRDPEVKAADLSVPLWWVTGSGHGHTLDAVAFRPGVCSVRAVKFSYGSSRKPSAFPEDSHEAALRSAEIPLEAFGSLLAGLRTILEARAEEWWSGPGTHSGFSTGDFLVFVRSPERDLPWAAQFCDYPNTREKPLWLRLSVAWRWFRDFEKASLPWAPAAPDAGSRREFSAVFLGLQESMGGRGHWWFVHERMLALARDFADETLVPPLAAWLAEGDPRKPGEDRRLCRAVNALARLTGEDLRFDPEGKPRPLEDVARDYRERHGGK
jgi:hypothetical protein